MACVICEYHLLPSLISGFGGNLFDMVESATVQFQNKSAYPGMPEHISLFNLTFNGSLA